MGYKQINVCLCEVCSHTWLSTGEDIPKRCAKCKSTHWDNEAESVPEIEETITQPEHAPIERQLIAEEEPIEPEIPEEVVEAEIEHASTRPSIEQLREKVSVITAKHSPPEKKAKQKKEKKAPAGKGGKCPHGFLLLDGGVTACKVCG